MEEVVRSSSPSSKCVATSDTTSSRHMCTQCDALPHQVHRQESQVISHTVLPRFEDKIFSKNKVPRKKTRSRVLIPSMSYCGQRSPSAVMTNDESLWQSSETLVSVIPGHSFHVTQATIVTKHGAAKGSGKRS